MPHSPRGLGQAAAIKRNAVPAKLYKTDETSETISKWKSTRNVESEDINIYVILQEGELNFVKEEEERTQWALLYNVEQLLELGWQLRFPEKGWKFKIRKTAPRPAIEPAYFKAWGVMHE